MDDHHFIPKMQKKKTSVEDSTKIGKQFATKCMTFAQGHHKIISTDIETSGIDHSETM